MHVDPLQLSRDDDVTEPAVDAPLGSPQPIVQGVIQLKRSFPVPADLLFPANQTQYRDVPVHKNSKMAQKQEEERNKALSEQYEDILFLLISFLFI